LTQFIIQQDFNANSYCKLTDWKTRITRNIYDSQWFTW